MAPVKRRLKPLVERGWAAAATGDITPLWSNAVEGCSKARPNRNAAEYWNRVRQVQIRCKSGVNQALTAEPNRRQMLESCRPSVSTGRENGSIAVADAHCTVAPGGICT
jgi:hypothetical protein